MRCKSCDYPLWNLKARACPECGVPFRPGEFEFVPNSVRFCCPYCNQAYYGTDARGHLEPTEFVCATCRTPLKMDEMVLRPAEGVEEEQTRLDRVPWIADRQTGRLKAWLRTVWLSLFGPARLVAALPGETKAGAAWMYAVLTLFAVAMLGIGTIFVAVVLLQLITGDLNEALEVLTVGGIFVGSALAGGLLLIVLWGLVAHAVLKAGGAPKRTLGSTYEALCFSTGATALVAIPCLGPYLLAFPAAIWWAINSIFMLVERQGVSGVRATIAVLLLPALLTLLGGGGGFAAGMYFMTQIPTMVAQAQQASATAQTAQLAAYLQIYAESHNGRGPTHVAQLLGDDLTEPDLFIALRGSGPVVTNQPMPVISSTTAEKVPLADTTLDRYLLIPEDRQQRLVQIMVEAQPDDVIAHRLGDFVFTYHGMNLADADPALWVVVFAPDPDLNRGQQAGDVMVGLVDRSSVIIAPEDFEAELGRQNELRAASGLPPLPDPQSVTHGRPAQAEP